MPRIVADAICVDYPILSAWSRSFRNVAVAKALKIGGATIHEGKSSQIVRALDNVSFTLNHGDRLALLGHNGAGKTTLIRTLAGIYTPVFGDLRVDGKQIPMFDIGLGLDEDATGHENIYIRGLVMGLSPREIARERERIVEFSELGIYLDFPIRTYSTGMKLRLMFAIATSIKGDIILLDEWIAVGDAGFRKKTDAHLRTITERSGILVMASHDLSLVRNICNLGLHLEHGGMCNFGPIEDVIAGMVNPAETPEPQPQSPPEETEPAEVAQLRTDRDGYKQAYETMLDEIGQLRADRDGYKQAYETIQNEIGQLRADRDEYKRTNESRQDTAA